MEKFILNSVKYRQNYFCLFFFFDIILFGDNMKDILEKIHEYSLEEIMGQRFGRYSKYIIQDRAIPDVRDGLKPVQRRILYAMYKTKNTYEKPYYKSASTVGEVIGKYHPHGDSSIYDAMVRMSQNWKMRSPHIDMQGNNGSIDGDSPAAYRYTEARLSKISNELLRDIDKDTIIFAPNFDDKHLEPTVLPARYPNLLVNGTTGISAGYATNIPPHNLIEIIDATIHRIDNPNCRLDTIMDIVKGPDFPTGGILEGIDGIKSAYETGRGRVIVRGKTMFEKNKIIINEIPYEVNKANLVRKIDEIRIDKKIDGIVEVRDESDKEGLQIAIDLKKESDPEFVLNYLLKKTELQVSYNFNMIAIVNRRPKLLGILEMLDAYIEHQKEVIKKRSIFDLATAKKEYHIVEGLIKAISILDDVIKTIRASRDKADAKENLVIKFSFTPEQAENIVMLHLYKLSNTDIMELKTRLETLNKIINALTDILADQEKLNGVIKDELRKIKREYGLPRITEIRDEVSEIKIDTTMMIPKEDVIVVVTKEGYVKRVSFRSYNSNDGETAVKDNDYVIGLFNINTLDTLLLWTNMGNYLYIPVYEIPELKWKELGKHVSNIIPLSDNEKIIGVSYSTNFNEDVYVTCFSKNGMVKRTKINEFKVQRYSKPISMMKLKDNDQLISVSTDNYKDVLVVTRKGYGLWYNINEIGIVGIKAAGVKAINLKDDEVVAGIIFDDTNEYISLITDKGTGKRLRLSEIDKKVRATRGILLMKEIKSNPSRIISAYVLNPKRNLGIKTDNNITIIKLTDLSIMDKQSNGSYVVKDKATESFIVAELIDKKKEEKQSEEIKEEINEPIKDVSLDEIDSRMMTIDDLLKNINKKEN